MASRIHVAVGVLIDAKDCVLLTRRLKGTHLAGYWEFPGGKVEAGESVQTALARELQEELGTKIGKTVPLMTVSHDYGEKQVLLDVHQVKDWDGEPHGAEGQPLAWVDAASLNEFQVPEANAEIMSRVKALLV
ncbi:MAG: 8-oxo-dGTP diphosphatase MutT [Luminiphilus sp.]|nr:8-oxo-dGTP diphosphatase MutT [Luminiphilus sp.]